MAHTGTLEAVIVVSIMVSAIVYVTNDKHAQSHENFQDRELETHLQDFLNTANEHALSPSRCEAPNELAKLVADGIQENHSEWELRKGTFFGPAYDVDLYLDNGRGLLPLHARGGFVGTTAAVNFAPNYAWSMPILHSDTSSGTEQLSIETIALTDSRLSTTAGEALSAKIRTTNHVGSNEVKISAVSGLLASFTNGSSTLSWAPAENLPGAWMQINANAPRGEVQLLLDAGPTHWVPDGAKILVSHPPGWTFSSNNPHWDFQNISSSKFQLTLLDAQANSSTARLHFEAPSTALHPFDVLHAQVLNSGLSQADLVVQYAASTDTRAPRSAYLSAPYPVFHGQPAAFTVAFANGAESTTVDRVTLEVPGGYDLTHNGGRGAALFAPGTPMMLDETPDGAWTWIDGKHLVWTGSRDVPSGGVASWRVGVNITSDLNVTTAIAESFRSLPTVNATFENGFSIESSVWGSVPGVLHLDVPNATRSVAPPQERADGYPAGAASSKVTTRVTSVTGKAVGAAWYNVSPAASHLVDLQTSVASSSFSVSDRLVPVGGVVTIAGDLQSVLGEAAKRGATNENLSVELYAPSSLGCKPTTTWSWSAGALPLSSITAATVWHGAQDALLVGTLDKHVYEIRVAADQAVTVWGQAVAGVPREFSITSVQGVPKLFVGDDAETVTALDLATGGMGWSSDAHPSIVALHANATSGTVFVASSKKVERLSLATGSVTSRIDLPDEAKAALESTDGGTYVTTSLQLLRFDAQGTNTGTLDLASQGFASTPSGLLVEVDDAAASTVLLVDPVTWTATPISALVSRPELVTAGDATGDGAPDLVTASQGPVITVIDGVTSQPWSYAPQTGSVYYGTSYPPYDPTHPQLPQRNCENELQISSLPDGYGLLPGCDYGRLNDTAFDVTHLTAGHGRIEYAYASATGTGAVTLIDTQGHQIWRRSGSQPSLPSTLLIDTWNGALAAGYGTTDGRVYLYSATSAIGKILETSPSGGVGMFSFSFRIPMGSLFGAHVLVSSLSWDEGNAQNGTLVHQAARLVDWFDVVDVTGLPVEHPTYRVAAVIQDRAAPKHDACAGIGGCPEPQSVS